MLIFLHCINIWKKIMSHQVWTSWFPFFPSQCYNICLPFNEGDQTSTRIQTATFLCVTCPQYKSTIQWRRSNINKNTDRYILVCDMSAIQVYHSMKEIKHQQEYRPLHSRAWHVRNTSPPFNEGDQTSTRIQTATFLCVTCPQYKSTIQWRRSNINKNIDRYIPVRVMSAIQVYHSMKEIKHQQEYRPLHSRAWHVRNTSLPFNEGDQTSTRIQTATFLCVTCPQYKSTIQWKRSNINKNTDRYIPVRDMSAIQVYHSMKEIKHQQEYRPLHSRAWHVRNTSLPFNEGDQTSTRIQTATFPCVTCPQYKSTIQWRRSNINKNTDRYIPVRDMSAIQVYHSMKKIKHQQENRPLYSWAWHVCNTSLPFNEGDQTLTRIQTATFLCVTCPQYKSTIQWRRSNINKNTDRYIPVRDMSAIQVYHSMKEIKHQQEYRPLHSCAWHVRNTSLPFNEGDQTSTRKQTATFLCVTCPQYKSTIQWRRSNINKNTDRYIPVRDMSAIQVYHSMKEIKHQQENRPLHSCAWHVRNTSLPFNEGDQTSTRIQTAAFPCVTCPQYKSTIQWRRSNINKNTDRCIPVRDMSAIQVHIATAHLVQFRVEFYVFTLK